jgi:galactokinase
MIEPQTTGTIISNIDKQAGEVKELLFLLFPCFLRSFFRHYGSDVTIDKENVEEAAIAAFRSQFGKDPALVVSAPGRVNLIGEHTDYNDGFVLPAAINRRTAVAAGPRTDNKLDIAAANLNARLQVSMDDFSAGRARAWAGYVHGVACLLMARGERLGGANLAIYGNVPRGGGLSSSAALEIAAAYALMTLNNITLPAVDIIRLCQKAEHDFAGVMCGIMDQFVSCLGRKDTALFLDCRSLDYRFVPVPPDTRIVVCDTGVKRALAASAYNTRRAECAAGVEALRRVLPDISSLRDVSVSAFTRHEQLLDPTVRQRCKHVIMENARVERAVSDLQNGDLSEFGKLMYDSHISLQHDYEVSCTELDAVVDICAEEDGVYGARMTGAGFGGCAIALVHADHAEQVAGRLADEYPQKTGKTPKIFICSAEHGVRVRRLS